MLTACGGGGSEGYYADNDKGSTQKPSGDSNQEPVDDETTTPGTDAPLTPSEPDTPATPGTSIPATPIGPGTPSIPSTPIGPSTPVKPGTSIPATPIGPSTPSIPSTPIGPSTPSIPSTPIGPSKPIKYPEPKKDVASITSLGFFDHNDRAGTIRTIRPDLVGSFQAMIQFGQNHTVDPQGNEANNMPRLTAEKEAILLVTPTLEMGDIDKLVAEIYKDGLFLRTVNLADPTQIPATDQTNTDARPRVFYSKRAWSTKLKWDEVQGGLKIRIIDGKNRSGELSEDKNRFCRTG